MKFLLILDTAKRPNKKYSQAEQEGCLKESLNGRISHRAKLVGGFHISKET